MGEVSAAEWLKRQDDEWAKCVTVEGVRFWIKKLRASDFVRIFKSAFASLTGNEQPQEGTVDVESFRQGKQSRADWAEYIGAFGEIVALCALQEDEDKQPINERLFPTVEAAEVLPLAMTAGLGREVLDFSGFKGGDAELAGHFRKEAE